MGSSACKEGACSEFADRFQGEKIHINPNESVEEYLYYLPKLGEAIETRGAPPLLTVTDYDVESIYRHSEVSEVNANLPKSNPVSVDDGEWVHRSIELIDGQRDEFGLITGQAKVSYKDQWTYCLLTAAMRATLNLAKGLG